MVRVSQLPWFVSHEPHCEFIWIEIENRNHHYLLILQSEVRETQTLAGTANCISSRRAAMVRVSCRGRHGSCPTNHIASLFGLKLKTEIIIIC